ncbi:MAG: hypothetical protein NXI04_06130 [Planctomycetaceae bacterium]|nr:hypothetical protein [Planctomycetaceae bacterium]
MTTANSCSSPHFVRQLMLAVFLLLTVVSLDGRGQSASRAGNREAPISSAEIAQAQQLSQSLGVADWLGPLAPVALSPFFGIACLSGLALYGQGFVAPDNAFLGEASPLHNETVFVVFLILTVLTSVPRFTKVSKPFAQAVDQVEAWAGIITMLVLKFLVQQTAGLDAETAGQPALLPDQTVVLMSPLSFTISTLLAIAAIINVFVINTVKFFFEVLIWITPIPTVDAIFEIANKAACAFLMAVYGYSPTLATVINLALFLAAAIVFRWVYRREVFFRTMLMDACWAMLAPPQQAKSEISVFPVSEFGPFAARTRCRLQRLDSGWRLVQPGLIAADTVLEISQQASQLELETGYFTNVLRVTGEVSGELTFSRYYNSQLPQLAECLGASLNVQDPQTPAASRLTGLKTELS